MDNDVLLLIITWRGERKIIKFAHVFYVFTLITDDRG